MGRKPEIKSLRNIDDLKNLALGDSILLEIDYPNVPFQGRVRYIGKACIGDYKFARLGLSSDGKGFIDGMFFYRVKADRVKVEDGRLKQMGLSAIPSYSMPLDNPLNLDWVLTLLDKLKLLSIEQTNRQIKSALYSSF